MADVSKIEIESGTYDIKDSVARENLQKMKQNTTLDLEITITTFLSRYYRLV